MRVVLRALWFLLISCIQISIQAQEERRVYVDKQNLFIKQGVILVRFSQGVVSVKQLGIDDRGYYVYPCEFMIPKSEGA